MEVVERRPILGHIHIPKCAGTTLRRILEESFGPDYLQIYVDDTFFVFPEQELERLLTPSARAFSSHSVRTFPPKLAGREILYMTFLREPVKQFVSYLYHVRRNFATIADPGLRSCLPPNLPQLSMRDTADWIMSQPRDINFRENYTVNFLARPAVGHLSEDEYRRVRLETVKEMLDRFLFVGISEHLEESLNVLRTRLARYNLKLSSGPAPRLNVSSEARDHDLLWLNERDRVGKRLLESVSEDDALYRWALARFQQQTTPSPIHRRLARVLLGARSRFTATPGLRH